MAAEHAVGRHTTRTPLLGDIGEEEEEIEVVPMPREVPIPEPSPEPAPEEVPA